MILANYAKDPALFEDETYHITLDDFTEELHKIVFGSLYNLYHQGVNEFSSAIVLEYLENKPDKLQLYKASKGEEYIEQLKAAALDHTFAYYYNRVKKMTLLRMYNEACGMDLSWLYDKDNMFDPKKKKQQEEYLDNATLEDIADLIDKRVMDIRLKYGENDFEVATQAGEGVVELLSQLKQSPDVGIPMYGKMINSITRGARLKRFYLRSASTGLGKTRTMAADACCFSCGTYYDLEQQKWIKYGTTEPTLFITTEQELSEIQTMILAFLSGVNEKHIVQNLYLEGEYERCLQAAEVLKKAPLYVKTLPDFSMQDVEHLIKKEIREHNIRYICYDYLHTSLKILSEISSKAGIKGLREDNVLFMMSTKLKEICVKYEVFILTSTQLNGDYRDAVRFDQNLIRGSKAVADKIDWGAVMLDITDSERESLKTIVEQSGLEMPTIKMSIYKNRGNDYNNILLWCKENRGICRIDPMFATDYSYHLIDIDDIKIEVEPMCKF